MIPSENRSACPLVCPPPPGISWNGIDSEGFSVVAEFGKLAISQFWMDRSALAVGTQMPKLDQFLMIHEAAEHLGVCRNTLRNWCRQGKILEFRHPVNNYRLFRVGDLDQLLQETERAVNNTDRAGLPCQPR